MESIKKDGKLAIICPVLNCFEYTYNFIKSIPKDLKCWIIIIDNGSTDRTKNYFTNENRDRRVDYVRFEQNNGVATSWNIGIHIAKYNLKCEYFLICNNDILIRKDTIYNLVKTIQYPGVLLSTPTNVNDGLVKPEELAEMGLPKKEIITQNPDFSCFLIKKETIEKIGNFDSAFFPAYFEDNDYHYRIKIAGFDGVKNSRALFYHFGSMTVKSGQDIRILSNSRYLQNQAYFIEKWGGKPGEELFNTPFNE